MEVWQITDDVPAQDRHCFSAVTSVEGRKSDSQSLPDKGPRSSILHRETFGRMIWCFSKNVVGMGGGQVGSPQLTQEVHMLLCPLGQWHSRHRAGEEVWDVLSLRYFVLLTTSTALLLVRSGVIQRLLSSDYWTISMFKLLLLLVLIHPCALDTVELWSNSRMYDFVVSIRFLKYPLTASWMWLGLVLTFKILPHSSQFIVTVNLKYV